MIDDSEFLISQLPLDAINEAAAARRVRISPTGTERAVCADITMRQQMGIAKYGTTVRDNPLELDAWLQHAYEEALDLAVYLKRAIEERKRLRKGNR